MINLPNVLVTSSHLHKMHLSMLNINRKIKIKYNEYNKKYKPLKVYKCFKPFDRIKLIHIAYDVYPAIFAFEG